MIYHVTLGYDGVGIGILIPVKQPVDGWNLDIGTRISGMATSNENR
jgi:hypothetical protein